MDKITKVSLDCRQDPIGALKQLFVDRVEANRIRLGQSPALRPVFSKLHGVAHGWFDPLPDLDRSLRVGVFALKRLTAWIRFSSDAQAADPDLRSTCGIGIKLFGVPGPKLLGDGDTQDFLLQNHDVFFVDTATDMCEFTRVSLVGDGEDAYRKQHPLTDRILNDMQKVESGVLSATYWSCLPYAFGDRRSVKYKLAPRLTDHAVPPGNDNYLAAGLAARLRETDATFDFYVQFQKDKKKQPLDQATVRWEEKESKPLHVATLTLPRQDINALGQANYGENLGFNPWHSLQEHAPQGSIAAARREVYHASANLRRSANGVPANEPGEPRRAGVLPPQNGTAIVRAAIYPPIGVARVGNSEKEYFIGPEVAAPAPQPPGFYRDSKGALKRQAARFRIYGLNVEGVAVEELTLENADIRWTVHLANKKAAWYQFQLALDIPEAAAALPSLLRNADVSDRASLIIDPGSKEIHGRNVHAGHAHTFDTGKFLGMPVYLGELHTDAKGRLIVLGGRGKSATARGKNVQAITFANNDGWYDDISDGPVTAEVTYRGQKLTVDPGWVVVAPPNYAPCRKSVRTMWDLMRDTALAARMLAVPVRPSFNLDIRPLFERLAGLQWVNAGFAASFGWHGPNNLATPPMLLRLSRNDPADAELRKTIANQFRTFDRDGVSPKPWPWQWGDAMNIPPTAPHAFLALSDTQNRMLQQWAAGDFESDYSPGPSPVLRLEDLPVSQQPDMLTRASMEFCVADAFHPGCELTWPMRRPSLYMKAFRISHANPATVEPQYGLQMTHEFLLRTCSAQRPGGLTRWLAVPWQTDSASCDSGYDNYDPYLPSFWPARVPNHVLTANNYAVVMDKSRLLSERRAAFAQRADWLRPLGPVYIDRINKMIQHFGEMGVVEQQPAPGDPEFPDLMEVESEPTPTHAKLSAPDKDTLSARLKEQKDIPKFRRFTNIERP